MSQSFPSHDENDILPRAQGDIIVANPFFLISDDHELFRRGLSYALQDQIPDARIIEANSFAQAMEVLGAQPDLTLASFDLGMQGMADGRSLVTVRNLYPRLPVVVLSGREGRQNMLSAIEYGASGFIPKNLPADEIVAAFGAVLAGRIYVPPSVVELGGGLPSPEHGPIPLEPSALAASRAGLASLTPRQRDVLHRLIAGRSTKEIGRDLDLAEGTVKIHLAALFRLLGARNRLEAVSRAVSLGLEPAQPAP